jgi:PAS domain S-box-containing protein
MVTHVLIVEDSPTQAHALQALLEDHGYAVSLARSGEEALSLVDEKLPDLVISDVVMPGIDGYELCRRLKAVTDRAEIPVMLLTTLGDPLDVIRGLEAGADNFLTKPYRPEHLLERVRHILDNGQLRRRPSVEFGVTVRFLGRTFTITADRAQILDLLISTFEDAVRQNRELRAREEELTAARSELIRQESLAQYKSLIENAPHGIYQTNPEGDILVANPAFAEILGFDSVDELLQTNIGTFYTDPSMRRAHMERDAGEQRIAGVEIEWRRKDGKVIWVRLSGRPVRDEADSLQYWEMIAEDVTERKARERQLELTQRLESVGQLAGGIAHDFNNLLAIILSYCDLLRERLDAGDGASTDLEEIRKAATSAGNLTRQLLAFSRQQVLEPIPVRLNDIVTRIAAMLERVIGEDIELRTALDENLGIIKVDPGHVEQAIVNLAVNARDAMPDGGRVTIETQNVELDEGYGATHHGVKPGKYVLLAVSDTGTGMDSETQKRAFEPFFTTKGSSRGTGLGLATVYGIVKQNGGWIWLYSELGHGSSFKLYFPRVSEPPAPMAERPQPMSLRGTETILVVEDDSALRIVTCRLLARMGYTVIQAADADAARNVASAAAGPIHLLLSDIVIPGTNGPLLAKELAQTHPDLKVLLMSGYAGDAAFRHGLLEEGVAFLPKPFTAEILTRRVRAVLDA